MCTTVEEDEEAVFTGESRTYDSRDPTDQVLQVSRYLALVVFRFDF